MPSLMLLLWGWDKSIISRHEPGLWSLGIIPILLIWQSKWAGNSDHGNFCLQITYHFLVCISTLHVLQSLLEARFWGFEADAKAIWTAWYEKTGLTPGWGCSVKKGSHSEDNSGEVMMQASCRMWIVIGHDAVCCNHSGSQLFELDDDQVEDVVMSASKLKSQLMVLQ